MTGQGFAGRGALSLGVIAAVLLVGCGGSDSQDGGSGRPEARPAKGGPTSQEFVRRVDALCQRANPELAQINTALIRARDAARAGRVSPAKTFAAFATLLRRATATTGRFEAGLREIPPPPAEREFHRILLDSVAQGSSNLRRQISAAERGDAVTLRELSLEGSRLSARTKGVVEGHGQFRFCGRG
jgi:hypothetical protein